MEAERTEHNDTCTICLEPLKNAVVLSNCIHRYCQTCILAWCATSSTCPDCRTSIEWLFNSHNHKIDITSPHNHTSYPLRRTRNRNLPRGTYRERRGGRLPSDVTPRSPDPDYLPELRNSSSSRSRDVSPDRSSFPSSLSSDPDMSDESSGSESFSLPNPDDESPSVVWPRRTTRAYPPSADPPKLSQLRGRKKK